MFARSRPIFFSFSIKDSYKSCASNTISKACVNFPWWGERKLGNSEATGKFAVLILPFSVPDPSHGDGRGRDGSWVVAQPSGWVSGGTVAGIPSSVWH